MTEKEELAEKIFLQMIAVVTEISIKEAYAIDPNEIATDAFNFAEAFIRIAGERV